MYHEKIMQRVELVALFGVLLLGLTAPEHSWTLHAQENVVETEWRKWGGPNGDFTVDAPPLAAVSYTHRRAHGT